MRRMVFLVGLLASMVLASAAFFLWPGASYALNRQLEPIQPGLYSSGQDGGCDDPDSKDRMLITKSEIHLYETHCRIRRISAQGYFHEIDTDCEAVGGRGASNSRLPRFISAPLPSS